MPLEIPEPNEQASLPSRRLFWALFIAIDLFITCALIVYFAAKPPTTFPIQVPVTIAEGMTVDEITKVLKESNVIRSRNLLYAVLLLNYDPTQIKAGTYTFLKPLTVNDVASQITNNGPQEALLTVTFPEGITAEAFADIAMDSLSEFDRDTFLKLAEIHEGTLFPDTYLIPFDFTAEELFALLQDTYTEKLKPLQEAIEQHTLSEQEVITLASIIEREANTSESMRMVSSVLQNRLEIDMALQADATIGYVQNPPFGDITPEALEIDSPYNTYLYRGLPPTPIGNPGLESIRAVLAPAETEYFYYVTGSDGNFYYAENFEEHKRNIARYLQ